MKRAFAVVAGVILAFTVVSLGAQSKAKPYAARTAWGDPDLQGVWDYKTITPLERPANFGDRQFLNDDEVEKLEANAAKRLDSPPDENTPVGLVHAPYMTDPGRKVDEDRRTSLIVDPPDGRIPRPVALSPEREKARAARAAAGARFNAGLPDTYRDASLAVRCIIRTDSPPYLPTIYNNDFQIFQSPGFVVIAPEMIHSARVIPVDGTPHLQSDLKQWLGDSRGHWEGQTLVVETTNFRTDDGVIFQNANPATFKIVERFTRTGPTALNYEFTVEDPTTWTKPWTARIPWNKIDPAEEMYEYACHEDNYDIVHFLGGARSREQKGTAKPAQR
jgi:hypothetical protein